jgi:hypothetical protein
MQDRTELLRGDFESISIIHRNLAGENPVSTGYVEMMEKQLEMTSLQTMDRQKDLST